jgi:3-isopropylmalate/(R)-2-methylmalate dehydratase large subunit
MTVPKTLFDKIWDAHVVVTREDGQSLIYVDRVLVQEGTFHAFDKLRRQGLKVRHTERVFAFADHYVPTTGRDRPIADPEVAAMVARQREDAAEFGIRLFGLNDPAQGILHVVAPEQGLTLPGLVIAGADSHTSTHGALGTFAFGVGASEAAHAMVVQGLWRARPKTMLLHVDAPLPFGTTAKDLALTIMNVLGAGGAGGHVVEYAGPGVSALSIEARMTLCNMTIEAGARAGLISPDDKTVRYLDGRPYAPKGEAFNAAADHWLGLATDTGAPFDRRVEVAAADVAPRVTWGTSPDQSAPVTGRIPDPGDIDDAAARGRAEAALAYMDLAPGTAVADMPIDRVFIGSCTNSRLEDLRAAAAVAKGRRARLPAMVVPGSQAVRAAAEAEGLDRVFTEAGFEWREPGCSMCVGINGDLVRPGERCASTSNRNFEGRQGRGARTHLVSPPMAAAAAVFGRFVDVRDIGAATPEAG